MIRCKSTGKEVSFDWSYHRISSTDSKVRTTLHVSIFTLGVKELIMERFIFKKQRNNFDPTVHTVLLSPHVQPPFLNWSMERSRVQKMFQALFAILLYQLHLSLQGFFHRLSKIITVAPP